ncbi:MAG: PilZ domain-containing protein [Bdellovibrionota bacterium]|nr:hypothetical protein [Pseudobdellovibrionaceae bacterium]|tara:strand:+ start:28852 stop:29526 length:675 start_codon:yes stop_codon:yes gene_type:complete
MLNFLVISPQNPYQKEFRNFVKSLEGVHHTIVDNIDSAKAKIHYNRPQVLMVHISKISHTSLKGIEQIRSPFDLPVILFTNSITESDITKIKEMKHYYILGRPYLSRDVLGVAFKMVHNEMPEQQLHRRYMTNQFTSLSGLDSDLNMEGNITNLSISGAKIKLNAHSAWKEGDLVKLDIPLNKIRKNHSVHAKVVWVEGLESDNEVGVEFIPTDEVYNHLLGSV